MLNIHNSTPDDLLRAATSLEEAGNFAGAASLCRQVLSAAPDHPIAFHLLGTLALHENQPQVAVEYLEKAVRGRPEFAGAHAALAAALGQVRRIGEAITEYRLALELDPQFETGRRLFRELLSTSGAPVPQEPDAAFAGPLVSLARAVGAKSNHALAAHLYERALDHNPDQPAVLEELGEVLVRGRQPQHAVDAFRAALAMNYAAAPLYHGLAKALHKIFDFKEAREACEQARRLDPGNLEIQWTLNTIEGDQYTFDVAAQNLRAALARDPGNKELQFQLAAISGDKSISQMPDTNLASAFDKYAATFDTHLVKRLQYKGPQVFRQMITEEAPGRTFDILDLGCGTGLCGEAFKPLARSLAGIDFSAGMIDRCRQRGIYDRLEKTDVVTALRNNPRGFDLITAADVFTYMGDLDEAFAAARDALRAGGYFIFWVERTDQPRFLLNRTTFRFTHHIEYLTGLGRGHGFDQIRVDDTPLRTQFGRPVAAWTMLLRKSG